MELKDAIAHAKEVAENKRKTIKEVYENLEEDRPLFEEQENACLKCAEEHEQRAAWLEELAERREKDRWIPVSERLPEESDFYLVTIADKYLTYVNTLFFMKSTPDMWEHDKRVIAWRPLPKPYESEA